MKHTQTRGRECVTLNLMRHGITALAPVLSPAADQGTRSISCFPLSLTGFTGSEAEGGRGTMLDREREGRHAKADEERSRQVQGIKERAPTRSLTPSSLHLNRRSSAATAASAGESPSYTERVTEETILFFGVKRQTQKGGLFAEQLVTITSR